MRGSGYATCDCPAAAGAGASAGPGVRGAQADAPTSPGISTGVDGTSAEAAPGLYVDAGGKGGGKGGSVQGLTSRSLPDSTSSSKPVVELRGDVHNEEKEMVSVIAVCVCRGSSHRHPRPTSR